LNILTIINSLGNSGQYFIPFFEGLINRGHNVVVISSISPLMCTKLTRIGINYVNLDKLRRGLSSLRFLVHFPLTLKKTMRIISEECIDIIHVHSGFMPLLLGFVVSNLKKIPLVLTIHGGKPSPSFRLNPIRQIHSIISTSVEQKAALPKDLRGVAVISLPIDLDRFFPYSDINTKKSYEHRISFFNSGAPNPVVYHLIELTPRILKRFGNVKILIVGWYSKYREVVETVSKLNEEIGREMIILTGFVEDTPKIMNQADIVIGVGMVAVEAMACGKPVIVAGPRTGPYGGSFGGIIDEQNVEELRRYNFTGRNSDIVTDAEVLFRSISELLSDEHYMKCLGEFGRRYTEKKFEPAKIGKQVEEVYKHALESAKDGSNFSSIFLIGWYLLGSLFYTFFKEVSIILKRSSIINYIHNACII